MTHRRAPVPATAHLSPNFDARTTPIDMIVLHYTGRAPFAEVMRRFCDPSAKKSAHFVIDESGQIFQLIDTAHRAWHAGVSSWQGQRDINSRSIGIELMNDGQKPFTSAQIHSVLTLCKTLMQQHAIPAHHVVGHSDVAPGRKVDPGSLFPWKTLAEHGIGLSPKVRLSDYFSTLGKRHDPHAIRAMLTELGYGQDFSPHTPQPLSEIIAAFHLRFDPQLCMAMPDQAGVASHRTLALLKACLREQRRLNTVQPRLNTNRPLRP